MTTLLANCSITTHPPPPLQKKRKKKKRLPIVKEGFLQQYSGKKLACMAIACVAGTLCNPTPPPKYEAVYWILGGRWPSVCLKPAPRGTGTSKMSTEIYWKQRAVKVGKYDLYLTPSSWYRIEERHIHVCMVRWDCGGVTFIKTY